MIHLFNSYKDNNKFICTEKPTISVHDENVSTRISSCQSQSLNNQFI